MTKVKVKIENAYSDGHESTSEVELDLPDGVTPDSQELDDWFTDVVFDHTGDGHGIDSSLGSCYTATIVAAEDPKLVGATTEWVD